MFHYPIPACVGFFFFSRKNFITYAEPSICRLDVALRFTAAVFVVSRLLPQILFHCKMMPISKAGRPVAVVWLLRRSGGESYLGRQLFSAHDVARNTSGSSHCFIREHINNFHWCTNEAERERGSVTQSLLSLCVCAQTLHRRRKGRFSENIQRSRWRVRAPAPVLCFKTCHRLPSASNPLHLSAVPPL